MKILLTGSTGQVGWELARTLAPLGDIVAPGHAELDLANPDALREAVRAVAPQVIVNAAAYTAVDRAESEPDLAMAVNAVAPGVLAEEAEPLGALLVHYSTDYVFDGARTQPYGEDDAPNPLGVYGRSKLAGEQAVAAAGCPYLILRTGWVYGARGKNFLRTMLRLADEGRPLRVVDDQFGAPTWCRMIAEATALILGREFARTGPHLPTLPALSGVYHLSAAGRTSWHGFAQSTMQHCGRDARVQPIPTAEYPTAARRPPNSVLDNGKLHAVFGIALPDWERQLRMCLEDAALSARGD